MGATALPGTLRLVRPGGTACFVGALSGAWAIPDLDPFSIPTGVRLTSYAGGASDLSVDGLDRCLHAIEAGTLTVVIAGVLEGLARAPDAHRDLESRHTPGKYVVVLPEA